jgi:Putative lipoprotein LpqV
MATSLAQLTGALVLVALIEAYSATAQAPGAGGAGRLNTAWRELTSARRMAVLAAVQAAADSGCGQPGPGLYSSSNHG